MRPCMKKTIKNYQTNSDSVFASYMVVEKCFKTKVGIRGLKFLPLFTTIWQSL